MNYFEIINKTLIELNYAPVSAFVNLTKMEHKKLMNIIILSVHLRQQVQ